MRLYKKNNIYRITRITGPEYHILGVVFDHKNKSDNNNNIEVIEWDFSNIDKSKIRISKEEVLEQVLLGLESINKSLGTNYKLSQIYFSPFDSRNNSVYILLIHKLIKQYHS